MTPDLANIQTLIMARLCQPLLIVPQLCHFMKRAYTPGILEGMLMAITILAGQERQTRHGTFIIFYLFFALYLTYVSLMSIFMCM